MQRIVTRQAHPLGKHSQTEVCDCVNSIHHACVDPLPPCLSVGVVVMDVLKVVQQLRDLAADPQNRATIVRVSLWPSLEGFWCMRLCPYSDCVYQGIATFTCIYTDCMQLWYKALQCY